MENLSSSEILGYALIITGVLKFLFHVVFADNGAAADARIVGHEPKPGDPGHYNYIIEFTTSSNVNIRTTVTNLFPGKHEVGNIVQILYDPEKPGSAYISCGYHLYVIETVLVLVGSCFVILENV